ncbi:hypothetical protein M3D92_06595 [Micrococcus terreus]|uniref:hypothetical protein n=1 Tax=Micrococcus terreus TaxID=574650 RepID=UPI0021A80817|nr:hypothetical protein [Micrococcus terreus]MCT2088958.1 hypothetical protein [Micrococcus terreus]
MILGMPSRYRDLSPTSETIASTPAFGALSAAAVAGLTLVEHRNLGPVAKAAYRLAYAGFAGVYGAAITQQQNVVSTAKALLIEDEPFPPESIRPSVVGPLAAGATLGLAELNEAIDGKLVDWIGNRGVSHPRALLAGVGAALMGAMWFTDRRETLQMTHDLDAQEMEPGPSQPLDRRVIAILERLLRDDLPGAVALRQQLDSVLQLHPELSSDTDLELEVDEDAPRAVPYTQVWPVQGRFTRDGEELAIELQIHQGRLSMISLMVPDAPWGADRDEEDTDYAEGSEQERAHTILEEMTEWPEVTEVRFVLDGES